jgi:hypothetical protein
MGAVLSFVIPVRHQENARDWNRVKENLSQTVASISGQTHSSWDAVIVANHGATLPSLPAPFTVCRVDFPPNQLHEQGESNLDTFRNAFRFDKGRRVLAGMLHLTPTGFIMICDDDDLVHRHLAAYVDDNPYENGWYVGDGWVWEDGERLLYKESNLHLICGTSQIIRSDLYNIPRSLEAASDEYLCRMLGSHLMINDELARQGFILKRLPFSGAIYRIGHPEAHSRSTGLSGRYFQSKNPLKILKSLSRLRLKTTRLERDYFGAKQV